jgi:hypothetical protein
MKHNITLHAIEQFIRRWEPNKTHDEARSELEALLRTSKIIGKTPLNDTVVASGHRPEIRMVVKDINVCVTVLPQGGLEELNKIVKEEMEEWKENNVRSMEHLESQIAECEEQIKNVDVERVALAKKKQELSNHLENLKYRHSWFANVK